MNQIRGACIYILVDHDPSIQSRIISSPFAEERAGNVTRSRQPFVEQHALVRTQRSRGQCLQYVNRVVRHMSSPQFLLESWHTAFCRKVTGHQIRKKVCGTHVTVATPRLASGRRLRRNVAVCHVPPATREHRFRDRAPDGWSSKPHEVWQTIGPPPPDRSSS